MKYSLGVSGRPSKLFRECFFDICILTAECTKFYQRVKSPVISGLLLTLITTDSSNFFCAFGHKNIYNYLLHFDKNL